MKIILKFNNKLREKIFIKSKQNNAKKIAKI